MCSIGTIARCYNSTKTETENEKGKQKILLYKEEKNHAKIRKPLILLGL